MSFTKEEVELAALMTNLNITDENRDSFVKNLNSLQRVREAERPNFLSSLRSGAAMPVTDIIGMLRREGLENEISVKDLITTLQTSPAGTVISYAPEETKRARKGQKVANRSRTQLYNAVQSCFVSLNSRLPVNEKITFHVDVKNNMALILTAK